MRIGYNEIRADVGDFLGWRRNSEGAGTDWTEDEEARMTSIIRAGLLAVYYPQSVEQSGSVHVWSWLRPVSDLTLSTPYATGTVTVADGVVTLAGGVFPSWAAQGDIWIDGVHYVVSTRDSDTQLTLEETDIDASAGTEYSLCRYLYDLPSDFAGSSQDLVISYSPDSGYRYPDIVVVPDSQICYHRQQSSGKSWPTRASIRPKSFDPTTGQAWQMAFHPTPSLGYKLKYRYKVEPDMLDATNKYPLGGPEIGELILTSCLAIAEQRFRGGPSVHSEQFAVKLRAAISNDAQSFTEGTLGRPSDGVSHPDYVIYTPDYNPKV